MIARLWVQIPAPYTGKTFFTLICCKNYMDVCLKRPKINEKEAGVGPFILKKEKNIFGTNALKLFCRKICCRKLQL